MITSAISFAAALQSIGSSSLPPVPHSVVRSVQKYGECLSAQSLLLEPSGASAEEIFLAAKTACATEHVDALEALTDDAIKTQNQSNASRIALGMLDMTETNAQNESRLAILRARAGRRK